MKNNRCWVNYKSIIIHPEPDNHIRDRVKVLLDLSNYATMKQLEHATGINTSGLAAKKDFIALEDEVNKLGIINWVMFQIVWIVQKEK